jgi:hypothetical protein
LEQVLALAVLVIRVQVLAMEFLFNLIMEFFGAASTGGGTFGAVRAVEHLEL